MDAAPGPPRAAGPRHRPHRPHPARHGPVQRGRLPVLGRRPPPRDGRLTCSSTAQSTPDRRSRSRTSGSSTTATTRRCAGRRCADTGYLVADRALLRPQPHAHAARSTPGPGGCTCPRRGRRTRPLEPHATRDLERLPSHGLTGGDRVRRERRPRPLRLPAGDAGRGHAVEARRHRRGPLARRAAGRGARPRRHAAPPRSTCMADGLDDPYVEDGVDQGRVRRPLPVGKALDDVLIALEMNGARAARPTTASRRASWCRAGSAIASIKWLGALEVSDAPARARRGTRRWYRGPLRPAGQERVRAGLGRARCPPGRMYHAHRPRLVRATPRSARVEVSTDGGASWRRARLRGPNLPHVLDALGAAVDPTPRPPRAAGPRHRPHRPDAARHRAVQRGRLPVLGGRPPSSDRGSVGPRGAPARADRSSAGPQGRTGG